MLNNTLFLNQDWNGKPKPSKTPREIDFRLLAFPFHFFNSAVNVQNCNTSPKPVPTAKKINKNTLPFHQNKRFRYHSDRRSKNDTFIIHVCFFHLIFTFRCFIKNQSTICSMGMLLFYFVE